MMYSLRCRVGARSVIASFDAKVGDKHLMKVEEGRHEIKAWSYGDVVFESYRYAPGLAGTLPKHSHEEYQFCFSLDFPGEYYYRGARHGVPIGSLSAIHPGEVHSARDPEDRQKPATFRMMYADPALLQKTAAEISESAKGHPFFPSPIILDRDLASRFLRLHAALEGTASDLERDSHLLYVLTQFVLRHADAPSSPNPVGKERSAVKLVREYLEDNYTENVSLEQLARLASLSTFHLARVFAEEVGLPPHAYQLGVRLARAKDLLLRGWPVAQTAFETGFADQSHLTRHFKRLVGVPPGRYAQNSKNVQYNSR